MLTRVNEHIYLKSTDKVLWLTIDEYELENDEGKKQDYYQLAMGYEATNKNDPAQLKRIVHVSKTEANPASLYSLIESLGQKLELIKISPFLYLSRHLLISIESVHIDEYVGNYPNVSKRYVPTMIIDNVYLGREQFVLGLFNKYNEALTSLDNAINAIETASINN